MKARVQELASLALLGCAVTIFFVTVGSRDSGRTSAGLETTDDVSQLSTASTAGQVAAPDGGASGRESSRDESARSAVSALALVGHVIDEETGRGVPGFVIQRKFAGRVTEEATTDETGSFRFSVVTKLGKRLEVRRQPGWDVALPKVRLNDAQVRGEEDVVFRAVRIVEAPIHGTVRDSLTEEPIPHILISFRQDGRKEDVETDEQGRYQTESSFARGAVIPFATDPPGLPGSPTPLGQQQHLAPGGEDGRLDLEAQVGPTYFLDFDPPTALGFDDFTAELIDEDTGYYLDESDWYRAPLRDGEVPWVRMRYAGRETLAPSSTRRLELQSRDGFWRGAARVAPVAGIHQKLLHIDLVPSGIFEGRVTDDKDRPLEGVWVYVEPVSGMAEGPFPRVATTEADGLFDFPWLTPGQYFVTTANDWYDPLYELAEAEVDVSAGEATVQNLSMKRVESAGAISGRLTSLSGTRSFVSTQLELRSLTKPKRRLITLIKTRKEGDRSWAVFNFDEVPEDEYELTVVGGSSRLWEPAMLRVIPPTDDADFMLLDQATPLELSFEVADAESGEILDGFRLVWHFADGTEKRMRARSNRYTLRGVAPDQRLSWTIVAPGYHPAFGSEQDFIAAVEPPEGYILKSELRRAQVRLQRGWGAKFMVLGPGSSPVSGARVLLDGEVAGVTIEDGSFLANSTTPPDKISVEYEDWVVSGGDLLSYEGSLAGSWGEIEVRLRPPN